MIDLFYWFEKSTASLGDYCTFCDVDYRQVVKHVNTRWLSLERAVGCVLQQFDALKSYFLSEGMYCTEYVTVSEKRGDFAQYEIPIGSTRR